MSKAKDILNRIQENRKPTFQKGMDVGAVLDQFGFRFQGMDFELGVSGPYEIRLGPEIMNHPEKTKWVLKNWKLKKLVKKGHGAEALFNILNKLGYEGQTNV